MLLFVFLSTNASLVSLVLLSEILLSLLVLYYVYKVKPYAKFPSLHLYLKLLKWILNRRNNVSFSTYFFKQVIEACKNHQNSGLLVCWLAEPLIFVYGEEIVKMILNEPAATDKSKLYEHFKFVNGNGIFLSNGEDWKKQRKIVNPALHGQSLKNKAKMVNQRARELVQKLNETKGYPTDDVLKIVKLCTVRIFFEATLGIKDDEIENDSESKHYLVQISRLTEFSAERIGIPWYQWDILLHFSTKGREILKANKEVKDFSLKVLENLKVRLEETEKDHILNENVPDNNQDNLIKHKYFAQSLIKEHLKNPSFTMEDVYHQFFSLVIAGFETTAYMTMWVLFMLGLHPDIQEQAYNEISLATEEEVKYADLQSLEYLECIIKETLRIYPVAPFFGRRLKKELQCGDIKIPKDASVILSIYMIHRNPNIYPDPEKFDPERFKEPAVLNKPWNFIPFAESLRPCVGKSYAMMQLKILLCHILRNFKVASLDRREEIDDHLSWELIMTCKKHPRVQFIPR